MISLILLFLSAFSQVLNKQYINIEETLLQRISDSNRRNVRYSMRDILFIFFSS